MPSLGRLLASTDRRSIILIIIAVLILFSGVVIYIATPTQMFGAMINPPKPMGDFSLESAKGSVSLSEFRGKLVVIYFGYTACPDVCPTTLANLRQALELLDEQQARQVQILFVSVDWKRDQPAKVTDYAHAFNPSFVGLTGSQEQIDLVTRQFGIFYVINPADANGFYSVDHTASTSVLDRQGNLTALWSYGMPPSEIASDMRNLLKK